LREGQAFLRRVIDVSPNCIFVKDGQGRYVLANRATAELYGTTPEEMVGQTDLDLARAGWSTLEEARRFTADDRAVIASGRPLVIPTVAFTLPDGTARWFREVKVPLTWRGEAGYILGVATDITGLKETERALREERDRAQRYLDVAGVMMLVLDADGQVVLINRRGCDILGREEASIVGRNWFDHFLPERVRDEVRSVFRTIIQGEDHPFQTYVNPVLTSDGEERIVEWHNVCLRDEAGRAVGVLSSGQDITERVQAQEERKRLLAQVQREAQRVQEIIETVPEGLVILDPERRVVRANPPGVKDLVNLAGARVGDTLTHLGGRPIEELLTSPWPRGTWHELTLKGPPRRFFQLLARPIENDPSPAGWVLVIRDITQQRAVERHVQQQERLATVGQLAAGVAHDFNNIMATIILHAQLAAQAEGLSPRDQERMTTIVQQAGLATDLVRQILDFSRRSVMERQPLDLLPLMKEQVQVLERTLPENIQVRATYGWDAYTVHADATRMRQVLMNLAVNARDAMPEGGSLRFGLERITIEPGARPPLPELQPGDWVRLTVTDTGVGIPPDVLPHIFDPFFTTKEPGEGSGLGLAQVYGIIAQHEGAIGVESTIGEGTTFSIHLPALPVGTGLSPAPPATAELPQGHGETILLVEDNLPTREALTDALETLNYRVLAAGDGREALELLAAHPSIRLVLSDVVMPRMGGVALLYALEEAGHEARMVLMSGHPLEERVEGLRQSHPALIGWLPKPPDLARLAKIIAAALSP